ncbi:glycine-rich domain-containing protein [Massilia sp. S19_KUP03_FR1]|uniref:glycine-rich domain-containing protein n=1 Tax=Massilia sp. S19_KUP03_FR1 TaxID=3025503 RepID=UPI002FCD05E3
MNTMQTSSAIDAINALDLGPIKTKLMHAASGEGWTAAHTDSVEAEYRRFLTLMKLYPNESTAPLVDVDTFWHYHILDTAKYAADCAAAFGYFLHHYPYLGLAGEEDAAARDGAGARMQELYAATFGASMPAAIASAPAWCGVAAAKATAWCGATTAAPAGQAVAWCGATTAKPQLAWCGATTAAPQLAWCGSATAAPQLAWCGATTAKPQLAWCGATTATPQMAWCGAARPTAVQVGPDILLTVQQAS